MCGIVGAIGENNVLPNVLKALKRLEYRGYDSAGFSAVNTLGRHICSKSKGNVDNLVQASSEYNDHNGSIVIAHTRWATHGKVTVANAHPHQSGSLSLVHNGIIENHQEIRTMLESEGYAFTSETDSESIVHLLDFIARNNPNTTLLATVNRAIPQLQGAFGILVFDAKNPSEIVVARSGSPMIIGLADNANYIASDEHSLLPYTNKFVYLDEGEIALVKKSEFAVFQNGIEKDKTIRYSQAEDESGSMGDYDSYMLKEMLEQPLVLKNLIDEHINGGAIRANSSLHDICDAFQAVEHIHIVACGTSYHSGLIAKDYFESYLNIPTSVEIASEYRYRHVAIPNNSAFICISQSGETADTLAALRKANKQGYLTTLTLCNSGTSSMVREAKHALMLKAGMEIGVASTKAFTTQLTAFILLTYAMLEKRNVGTSLNAELHDAIISIPGSCVSVINLKNDIKKMAQDIAFSKSAIFLGRGQQTAIAMEGALKLKEISYIHAEAYPAGELKHGPLALIDENMPVIVTAPMDATYDKLISNIEEVNARGGKFFIFADERLNLQIDSSMIIKMPKTSNHITAIPYVIALQLLSYYTAIEMGCNVDQPRSLAKSVTVE